MPFALFILGNGSPGVILGAGLILAVPEHVGRIALGALTIALGLYSRFVRNLACKKWRGTVIGRVMRWVVSAYSL